MVVNSVTVGIPVGGGTFVRGGSPTSVQGGLFKTPSTESLSSGEWQVLNEAMVLQQINLSLDQEVPRHNSSDSGRSSSVTDDDFSSTPTQNGSSERLDYLKASQDVVNEEIDLNLHVKRVLTRCQHGKTRSIVFQIKLTCCWI